MLIFQWNIYSIDRWRILVNKWLSQQMHLSNDKHYHLPCRWNYKFKCPEEEDRGGGAAGERQKWESYRRASSWKSRFCHFFTASGRRMLTALVTLWLRMKVHQERFHEFSIKLLALEAKLDNFSIKNKIHVNEQVKFQLWAILKLFWRLIVFYYDLLPINFNFNIKVMVINETISKEHDDTPLGIFRRG